MLRLDARARGGDAGRARAPGEARRRSRASARGVRHFGRSARADAAPHALARGERIGRRARARMDGADRLRKRARGYGRQLPPVAVMSVMWAAALVAPPVIAWLVIE